MTNVTYDDFTKLDLRIAKIISTEKIPGKSRIIKGVIDIGDEKREVVIGGAEYYQPEELVGKTV
ncbi:MAG: tRNA-binding protein, partial [Thermoproteota archaeon]